MVSFLPYNTDQARPTYGEVTGVSRSPGAQTGAHRGLAAGILLPVGAEDGDSPSRPWGLLSIFLCSTSDIHTEVFLRASPRMSAASQPPKPRSGPEVGSTLNPCPLLVQLL